MTASRRRLRVCVVAERARPSDGWARYAVELARGMREHGIEPVLALAETDIDPALDGIEHHVILPPLFTRRFETPRSLLAAPRLARVLATCAVVHGVPEPYMPLVALACRARQPYVQTAHGSWAVRPFESAARRSLFAPALKRVNLLVCQSRFTRDAMASRTRLPSHVVLSGGVRIDDFSDAEDARLPAWAGDARIVLCVGAVKPRKGLHVTLEAVAEARRRHPDLRLVLAGRLDDTPYAEYLQSLASARGMSGRLHLLGGVDAAELRALYHRAAVCMQLPINQDGKFEGLGLTYLEAAASATPSIGTRGCGAEDAIADGETGFLVPQNDPGAAATALCRLLDDEALRTTMGCAARTRVSGCSWSRVTGALAARYRELAGEV